MEGEKIDDLRRHELHQLPYDARLCVGFNGRMMECLSLLSRHLTPLLYYKSKRPIHVFEWRVL